jgi:hypothetical protein
MLAFIQRYMSVFGIISAFCGGWYSSYTYYSVRQLKIDLNASNQEVQTKDRLLLATKQNIENINKQSIIDYQQKQEIQKKYEEQIQLNADYKNYINANNIITHDFMRRVGALKSENDKLRANSTTASSISTTDRAISAYEYGQWAVGLKAHDDSCVVSFNSLVGIYNQQKNLVNGFK